MMKKSILVAIVLIGLVTKAFAGAGCGKASEEGHACGRRSFGTCKAAEGGKLRCDKNPCKDLAKDADCLHGRKCHCKDKNCTKKVCKVPKV